MKLAGADERLHGEESGVVQHLEIHGAMRGIRGVVHIRPNGHPDLGIGFAYGDGGAKELVDRRVDVHPLECAKVGLHGEIIGDAITAQERRAMRSSVRAQFEVGEAASVLFAVY